MGAHGWMDGWREGSYLPRVNNNNNNSHHTPQLFDKIKYLRLLIEMNTPLVFFLYCEGFRHCTSSPSFAQIRKHGFMRSGS